MRTTVCCFFAVSVTSMSTATFMYLKCISSHQFVIHPHYRKDILRSMLMTKAKPNWTHVQGEVIKCVQTREFLEIMAAGMFWQNTKGHKILSRKKGGKKLPCYPSLTFFCPRWFCLASTSYRILIGLNFWRSRALKRSGSFGEHKRQLLLFRHYDLWFLWAPAHGNISFKLPRPLPADDM